MSKQKALMFPIPKCNDCKHYDMVWTGDMYDTSGFPICHIRLPNIINNGKDCLDYQKPKEELGRNRSNP